MEFGVVVPLGQFLLGKRGGVDAVHAQIDLPHGGFGGLVESLGVGTFVEFHEIVIAPFAPVLQILVADVVEQVERGAVGVGGHVLVDGDDLNVSQTDAAPSLGAQFGDIAHLHAEALGRRFGDGVGFAVDPVVPVARNEFKAEDIPAAVVERPEFDAHLAVVVEDDVG